MKFIIFVVLFILFNVFFLKSISIKYNENKVALIFHVGNIEVFHEIVNDYPDFFNNKRIDLYFSCNDKQVFNIVNEQYPNSKIFQIENRGMDIGPFLLTIKYLIDNKSNYDYYIKLHTKTDKNWRNSMIKPIYNNLDYFMDIKKTNNNIKLFGSKNHHSNANFNGNYSPILELIKRNYPEYIYKFLSYCSEYNENTVDCSEPPYFIAGTIFVFNNKYFDLFKQIKDLNYEFGILETGYVSNGIGNPRKTHAWEYLFGYILYLKKKKINIL